MFHILLATHSDYSFISPFHPLPLLGKNVEQKIIAQIYTTYISHV